MYIQVVRTFMYDCTLYIHVRTYMYMYMHTYMYIHNYTYSTCTCIYMYTDLHAVLKEDHQFSRVLELVPSLCRAPFNPFPPLQHGLLVRHNLLAFVMSLGAKSTGEFCHGRHLFFLGGDQSLEGIVFLE